MSETTFAKTFLTTLDSRPAKLSPDHVEDARNFPSRPPYILPRMPAEMSRPKREGGGASAIPGQERSVTITLRSLRNPPLDVKLAAQPLSTSLLDVKQAVAERARVPADKLRILHNKRPLQDSKILSEVLGDDAPTAVEFSVMVIGGAAAVLPPAPMDVDSDPTVPKAAPKAKKGVEAVETPEFWTDLNGFLMQRVKDEETAAELTTVFRNAWESHKAKP